MHKQALKQVFSKPSYLIISASVFTVILVALLHAREFLFFEPYFVFQLPEDLIPNFVLIMILSALVGIVLSMSIYQIRILKASKRKMSSGLVGSFVGAGTGICTGCSSIGITIISTLGIIGATTLSFLNYYETPIRIVAIAILVATYFLMVRGITSECKINPKYEME